MSAVAARRRVRRALGFTAVLLVLVGGLMLTAGYARGFSAWQPVPGVSMIILLTLSVDAASVILALAYARLAGRGQRSEPPAGES